MAKREVVEVEVAEVPCCHVEDVEDEWEWQNLLRIWPLGQRGQPPRLKLEMALENSFCRESHVERRRIEQKIRSASTTAAGKERKEGKEKKEMARDFATLVGPRPSSH